MGWLPLVRDSTNKQEKKTIHISLMCTVCRSANVRNAAFETLRWPIYIINPVDDTKFSSKTPNRRNTVVSLQTYPLLYVQLYRSTSLAVLNKYRMSENANGKMNICKCEYPSKQILRLGFDPDRAVFTECRKTKTTFIPGTNQNKGQNHK